MSSSKFNPKSWYDLIFIHNNEVWRREYLLNASTDDWETVMDKYNIIESERNITENTTWIQDKQTETSDILMQYFCEKEIAEHEFWLDQLALFIQYHVKHVDPTIISFDLIPFTRAQKKVQTLETLAREDKEFKLGTKDGKRELKKKTAVCTFFLAGKCREGVGCEYVHDEQQRLHKNYKSKLCKYHPNCKHGSTCNHAHGSNELVQTKIERRNKKK